jgi:uncharacterized OsmC-like protein
MKVSKEPEDILVTYSLGSCVGVALYDPLQKMWIKYIVCYLYQKLTQNGQEKSLLCSWIRVTYIATNIVEHGGG